MAFALLCAGALSAWGQQAYPILPTWRNTGPGSVPFVVTQGAVTVGADANHSPVNAVTGLADAFGTRLPITQTTNRAIIDWQGFSIGAGNQVNISQPGTSSILLNRVTGAESSTISGSLTANGRVFLINPNGVLFDNKGPGNVVNVGGLVASTLGMTTSDADFMNGTNTFAFGPSSNSSVENQGQITTPFGGTVALISGNTLNSGTITTPGGTAALGAGGTVTLDIGNDGLTKLTVTPGSFRGVTNSGTMQADGGRVALVAGGGEFTPMGVVNFRGVLRADSLGTRNGEIILDSGSSAAGVTLTGGSLSVAGLGVGQTGGKIDITGQTILVQPYQSFVAFPAVNEPATFDASGNAGGGSITLRATAVGEQPQTGALAVAAGSVFNADATGTGNGGTVRLLADRTLRAHGTITAKGGPGGGDGGLVETSSGYAIPVGDNQYQGGFDLNGVRVDASAANGKAGRWLIDPANVAIQHGAVNGDLPAEGVFAPIGPAASTLQDGDINAALNSGTNVTVTTGTPGAIFNTISMAGDVNINYTAAKGPLTFELNAGGGISTLAPGAVIQSSGAGGPLNVTFNAGGPASYGSIQYNGDIVTQGGNVAMTAGVGGGIFVNGGQMLTSGGAVALNVGAAGAPTGSVVMSGNTVDTRVGQNDAGPGGSVQIAAGQVSLRNSRVSASTGQVDLLGTSDTYGQSGVELTSGQAGPTTISTTSGNVTVQGVARRQPSSGFAAAHGVLINGGSSITSGSGNIAVRGYNFDSTASGEFATRDSGVRLEQGAQLITTGGGNIEVTGRSQNGGAGIALQAGGSAQAGPGALPRIQSSGNVVLRASNDGSTDAIVIEAPVIAAGVINLRPGGVDSALNATDNTATPITLGGASVNGFSISSAEFAQLSAPTIVAGSNAHAADITVAGALATPGAITLQNGAGGNIMLDASVTAGTVGLISAGNITQAQAAPITAGLLLARSTGGNVNLTSSLNDVSVHTVGGGAAGSFAYVDANAVTLGQVSATGFDAASNQAQVVASGPMSAATVFVRTLTGDLSLATNVSSSNGTDLVAAARFENLGTYTIAGAPWRVWADTWVGETRGGLAGTGPLPNFYHCAYLGLCTVTVTPADNHFIYAQQPVAAVQIGDATRGLGLPNPPFIYSISGLILGDTGAGFAGLLSSTATRFSVPGLYPITGSFTSAEGYAVNVVPGQLRVVGGNLPFPKVDVLRDLPTTYLYDRNIGQAPICLATGPLDGDRSSQGGDVLAREWSRVRSRPNLLNCVDTEKRNGCADF